MAFKKKVGANVHSPPPEYDAPDYTLYTEFGGLKICKFCKFQSIFQRIFITFLVLKVSSPGLTILNFSFIVCCRYNNNIIVIIINVFVVCLFTKINITVSILSISIHTLTMMQVVCDQSTFARVTESDHGVPQRNDTRIILGLTYAFYGFSGLSVGLIRCRWAHVLMLN